MNARCMMVCVCGLNNKPSIIKSLIGYRSTHHNNKTKNDAAHAYHQKTPRNTLHIGVSAFSALVIEREA